MKADVFHLCSTCVPRLRKCASVCHCDGLLAKSGLCSTCVPLVFHLCSTCFPWVCHSRRNESSGLALYSKRPCVRGCGAGVRHSSVRQASPPNGQKSNRKSISSLSESDREEIPLSIWSFPDLSHTPGALSAYQKGPRPRQNLQLVRLRCAAACPPLAKRPYRKHG